MPPLSTQPATEPLTVRPKTARQMLGVSERKLAYLLRSGKLKYTKLDRMTLIHMSSIKALLADTSIPST